MRLIKGKLLCISYVMDKEKSAITTKIKVECESMPKTMVNQKIINLYILNWCIVFLRMTNDNNENRVKIERSHCASSTEDFVDRA